MSYKLSEVCDVRDGTHDSPSYVTDGYPLVTSKNIVNGKLDISTVSYISKEDYNKINERSKVDSGDILMPMIGTIGNPLLVGDYTDFAIKNVALIKFNTDKVINKYILYFLKSNAFVRYVEGKNKGGTQKFLALGDIRGMMIPEYSLENQREIVRRLDKVSEIIVYRGQQLEKLDLLVKSRFVEMFGMQDYTKESLENNVEEMFIGPFGSSLKNECFVEKEKGYCMVYEQKHAIQKTMDLPTRYITEDKYQELKRFTVLPGDIIVSCRGTIGEIFAVPMDAPLGIMHPSIMKIRLKKNKYNYNFFVFALEQSLKQHEREVVGSSIKMAITATALGKEKFIIPDMEVQNNFVAFVQQVDKSKFAIKKSLEKLELLKKKLMQDYFG